MPSPIQDPDHDAEFVRRAWLSVGIAIGSVLFLAVLWLASHVFLVFFAGVLLAILLRLPVDWLQAHTRLGEGAALAATLLGLAGLLVLFGWLFAVPVGGQVEQLASALPAAFDKLRDWLLDSQWGMLTGLLGGAGEPKFDMELLGRATGVISSTFSALASVVVVLFIGIYLAAQPRLYERGFLCLIPRMARPRTREIFERIADTLKNWLLARLITMAVVGSAAGLGLWLIGIPVPFALGLLTGLLEFVPYIGPILAAVPPLLIAFGVDPTLALTVLGLYVGIQSAENYLLSPLIEQHTVKLPPALVVFSTVLMGVLFGGLGVALASPLTATCIVAVTSLYVEDVLESKEQKRQEILLGDVPPPVADEAIAEPIELPPAR